MMNIFEMEMTEDISIFCCLLLKIMYKNCFRITMKIQIQQKRMVIRKWLQVDMFQAKILFSPQISYLVLKWYVKFCV